MQKQWCLPMSVFDEVKINDAILQKQFRFYKTTKSFSVQQLTVSRSTVNPPSLPHPSPVAHTRAQTLFYPSLVHRRSGTCSSHLPTTKTLNRPRKTQREPAKLRLKSRRGRDDAILSLGAGGPVLTSLRTSRVIERSDEAAMATTVLEI